MAELSSRLSRLEGLMLELSGHLLPVLRQLLGKKPPPDIETILPEETLAPPLAEEAADSAQDHPASSLQEPQASQKSWWSRIWGR